MGISQTPQAIVPAEFGQALAPFLVQKVTGSYYTFQPKAPTQLNPVVNTTYFTPIYLTAGTYDRLKIRTGNAL
ncbi:MAG: hypothetical protein EB023_13755, partial [Flavobacteriia bacterium]|nr:hypothetical protein [Flavobacteriia bacterium]